MENKKNKKILISGLVAMCLTLVLGIGLLFAGMFSKEEVKYKGQDEVYIDCLWGISTKEVYYIYEIDQKISYSNSYSIFDKGNSQNELTKFSENLLRDIENVILEEQATFIDNTSYGGWNLYNLSLYEDKLDNDDSVKFIGGGWGDAYKLTGSLDYFLHKREIKTDQNDDTTYATVPPDDDTSSEGVVVDLSPLQTNVNDYINANTTTLNFTSEIVELIFGSLLIISSIVGGTIIIYRNKKQ